MTFKLTPKSEHQYISELNSIISYQTLKSRRFEIQRCFKNGVVRGRVAYIENRKGFFGS